MIFVPQKILPENLRFFKITQIAYIIGLTSHVTLGFRLYLLKVHELAWLNLFLSVPVFLIAFFINRRGLHGLAFLLAFFELFFHQIAAVYFIGLDSGYQYILIFLAALGFFNARWSRRVRLLLVLVVYAGFALVFFAFDPVGVYRLSPAQYTFYQFSSGVFTMLAVVLLINYYVRSVDRAEKSLKEANQKLSRKNIRIQSTLNERDLALQALGKELSEASQYVQRMLPEPVNSGRVQADWRYRPSTSLGGDAFGYQWLDDNHFAFYVLDVSGHGVGAALLSVTVMNILQAGTLNNVDFKSPAKIFDALNQIFCDQRQNEMFLTMWYGVYRASSQTLTFASAGHPPALLLSGREKASRLRTPNTVIGGIEDATYVEENVKIPSGSAIYLFSDGVFELEKPEGGMWRFFEFADFLSEPITPQESRLERLLNRAIQWSPKGRLEDDFTALEFRFS